MKSQPDVVYHRDKGDILTIFIISLALADQLLQSEILCGGGIESGVCLLLDNSQKILDVV
jgi:hypothetical protein